MCGIVGYVGPRNPIPIIVRGLEKLEYRGYDSSGVACVRNSRFEIHRAVGKLKNLRAELDKLGELSEIAPGGSDRLQIGLGHTRWATHGRPCEQNAHPHIAGKICLVHNGIIENYALLREMLSGMGCKFSSETDTEIAAHLINVKYEKCGDFLEAVRQAIAEVRGSYALVVTCLDFPDRIIVAKNSTPVIVGIAQDEVFVASDIPAVLEHTREILILEDQELAEIKVGSVHIEKNGEIIHRETEHIAWDPITAEKGGFRHFMLKEIYEQPQVVTDTLRTRIDQEHGRVLLDELSFSPESLKSIDRIIIVACGTAWHAALITKFYIEQFAHIPVEVDYGSEFRYRNVVMNEKVLFMVISQSGETADTLGSLQIAAEHTPLTLAICNVLGSSIARKASCVLYTHAGPEISVASTKAFVTQVSLGYLLAVKLGVVRGVINAGQERQLVDDIVHLPVLLTKALGTDRQMEKIARKYGRTNDFLYLGRGVLYPVALEGALKLKELSYIHAEGYPAGEMKHGPIALINEETPVVFVFGQDGVNYEKSISNLIEVESRGGRVIAIGDRILPDVQELAWESVSVGDAAANILPVVLAVPLQLLAYHVAVYRGTDVDQPRNLAKSVTVE